MTIWEVLGIEPTDDKEIIKNAYREQVSLHHPEDDPVGFKKVRSAYETALKLSDRSAEHAETADEVNRNGRFSQSTQMAQQQLLEIMSDSQRRFNKSVWLEWIEQIIVCPIDEQTHISQALINYILDNRWIPGELVALFWEQLDWDSLLNSEDTVQLGQFLLYWSKQSSLVGLDGLAELNDCQQRSFLGYVRPLMEAYTDRNLNALNYWGQQSTCFYIPNCLELKLFHIRIWNAIGYPRSLIVDLLVELLSIDSEKQYSVEALEILGEASLNIGYQEATFAIARMMLEQQHSARASDLLRRVAKKTQNLELSYIYAVLQHREQPLPEGFWQSEFPYVQQENLEQQRRLDWLKSCLVETENNSDIFRTRLDFLGQQGLVSDIVKGLWAVEFGSWAWLKEIGTLLIQHRQTSLEQDDALSYFAIELILNAINDVLADIPDTCVLEEKFDLYETDEFLSLPELSAEECSSLNEDQWMEFLLRHPLTPDSWLYKLAGEKIIRSDNFSKVSGRSGWCGSLYFYRFNQYLAERPSLCLSSVFNQEAFNGVFDWTLMACSLIHHEGDKKYNLDTLSKLKPLPKLSDPFFRQLSDIVELEGKYDRSVMEKMVNQNGCNLVINIWVLHHVRDLVNQTESTKLASSLATSVEPILYAVLTWQLLKEENLQMAMLMWSCFVPFSNYISDNYLLTEMVLYHKVHDERDRQGFTKNFYSFYEPEIIYSLTNNQFENLTPTNNIDLNRGDAELRRFVLPAYYVALQLRYAVDLDTMNKQATGALLYWQNKEDETDWRCLSANILLTLYVYMIINWREVSEKELFDKYILTSIDESDYED